MLTLFFLIRKKIRLSAVALGLAINSREINIIYLPLYFLSVARPAVNIALWHHVIKKLLPATGILLCMYAVPLISQKMPGIEMITFGSTDTLGMHPIQKLFSMRYHWLAPFFFAYSLVAYWLLLSRRPTDEKFFYAGSFCILTFLIFIEHSAHYVSWLTVFMAASLSIHVRLFSLSSVSVWHGSDCGYL